MPLRALVLWSSIRVDQQAMKGRGDRLQPRHSPIVDTGFHMNLKTVQCHKGLNQAEHSDIAGAECAHRTVNDTIASILTRFLV
jgi:hypothetical protein